MDTQKTLAPTQSRRAAITQIIRQQPVGRQEELAALLRARGFEVTQSSISRDLRELGVAKAGDRYIINTPGSGGGESLAAMAVFVRAVQVAGAHITVIKTTAGTASSVALAIDQAAWPEVTGTVAGDDTIFAATVSAAAQKKLLARLRDAFGV